MMGKCIGVLSIAVGVLFVVGHRGVSVAVCSWWFKPNIHQKNGGEGEDHRSAVCTNLPLWSVDAVPVKPLDRNVVSS